MEIEEAREFIKNLNNPRLGSFGEYVFEYYVKNILREELKRLHRDGADFVFRNNKVDVGARRMLDHEYTEKVIKNKDVSIFFFKDYCSIISPNQLSHKFNWLSITSIFKDWTKKKDLKTPAYSRYSYEAEYNSIKKELNEYFNDIDLIPRVIYRCVTEKFGYKESPDNLFLQSNNGSNVTIYLDFKDYQRTKDNINFIIAFPHTDSHLIPRLKKVRLKSGKKISDKADLEKIIKNRHNCYFDNFQELISEYEKRYKI